MPAGPHSFITVLADRVMGCTQCGALSTDPRAQQPCPNAPTPRPTRDIGDTAEPRHKKRGVDYTPYFEECSTLIANVRTVEWEKGDYSDPSKLGGHPFPYIGEIPSDRFRCENGFFSYMGREKFGVLLDAVEALGGDSYKRLFLWGTMGFGKSHILAALVSYLLRMGRRVVFIPDCKAMYEGSPHFYLMKSLFLAFHDKPEKQKEIANSDNLIAWCINFSSSGDKLLFVVDQYNAFESSKIDSAKKKKQAAKSLIREASDEHLVVFSSSANNEIAQKGSEKQTNMRKMTCFGGFSEREFQEWRRHYEAQLPVMDEAETKTLEEVTGNIPLFLTAFMDSKENFDAAIEHLHRHPLLNQIPGDLSKATEAVDENRLELHLKMLEACVKGTPAVVHREDLYDHRYMYFDDNNVGHCISLIVRNYIAHVLRDNNKLRSLDDSWTNVCYQTDNPVVKGFLAEQIILSEILAKGLVAGETFAPQKYNIFTKGNEEKIAELSSGCVLFIPHAYNYRAIDALIRRVSKENNIWRLEFLAIQITLQKPEQHAKSINQFFRHSQCWFAPELLPSDTSILWNFIWITKEKRECSEHSASNGRPAYTEYFVSFVEVCNKLQFLCGS